MKDSFRELLENHNLDALLVSNPINSYYLLDYKTVSPEDRDLWTLVTKQGIYAFTHDLNYALLAKQAVKGNFGARLMNRENSMAKQIAQIVKKEQIKTIGIESEDLRVGELVSLQKSVRKESARVRWKKTNRLILLIRVVKRQEEIAYLSKACEVADQCLESIVKTITFGQDEQTIARRLVACIREEGYEPSFAPIVALDANAAIPHYDSAVNTGRIKKGSLILIDYGVNYRGYCSDSSRVLFYGRPSTQIQNVYEKLLKAQEQTIANVSRFKKAKDVDRHCRNIMKQEGLPHDYPHVTGHGVGLQVHEPPLIHFRSKDTLTNNQTITIEPGIYVPGKYGMRIEDTVLIGEGMRAVQLTKYPKNLQIIGH